MTGAHETSMLLTRTFAVVRGIVFRPIEQNSPSDPCSTAGKKGETARRGSFPPSPDLQRLGLLWLAVLMTLTFAQSSAMAASATLTAAEVVAEPGTNPVCVPISLSVPPGQRIAALQFDVEFDAAAMEVPATAAVVPSTALKAAGKQVNYSALASGKVRVLIVGFNQEDIRSGELVTVMFTMRRAGMHALESVNIQNGLLSDPNGSKVSETVKNGGIRFSMPSSGDFTGAKSESVIRSWALACGIVLVCMIGGVIWTRRERRKHRNRTIRPRRLKEA